jgi:hypothetical protein
MASLSMSAPPVTGQRRRLKLTCPDEASTALGKLLVQADGEFERPRPTSALGGPVQDR